jgi:hypothetical protein
MNRALSVIIFILFHILNLSAQQFQSDCCGASVGVSIQFGTHINRIGLFAKSYAIYKDFQLNADVRWHFNYRAFGPDLSGSEFVYKIGAVWAWGDVDTLENPFLSPVGNQLGKRNSIGYSFNHYFDNIATNQKTGFISIQLNRLHFIMENDAFAGAPADKYRTAAAILQYRISPTSLLSLNTILWTGDPFTNFIDTQTFDDNYPSQYGYRDMSNASYGNYSNGIFGLQFKTMFPFGQEMRYDIGFDSEWIRHFFQNIIIHDLYILPKVLNPMKHPHIPMVSNDGSQYLFLEGQKVKPMSLFAQFGWNGTVFY